MDLDCTSKWLFQCSHHVKFYGSLLWAIYRVILLKASLPFTCDDSKWAKALTLSPTYLSVFVETRKLLGPC